MISFEQAEKTGKQVTNFGDYGEKINSCYGLISRIDWQLEEKARLSKEGIFSFLAERNTIINGQSVRETALYLSA